MLNIRLSLPVLFVATALLGGCGEEAEPSPEEKWGAETQAVRVQIFRDGTVTRKLQEYRMNAGQYPTTEQGLDALLRRPQGVEPKSWVGPYFDSEEEITDKWGNKLRYACPGKTFPDDKAKYDLWSCGPNGQDDGGTGDDILNHNVR